MRRRILIYGATGYTGRLIAERARNSRCAAIVAGRTASLVQTLASTLGVSARVVALDEPDALDQALGDICVVINAASPFAQTARPIIEACLRTRTHYLDIAGELPAFQDAHSYDDAARECGVMIMPGVGLGIVASDCLAMHVAALVPNAKYLRIGLARPDLISRGSLRTVLAMADSHVSVRRNGRLISLPAGRLQRAFDYGDGERQSVSVSWADIFTAYYSTGIRNIEAYIQADLPSRTLYQLTVGIADALRYPPIQRFLSVAAEAWPEGPSALQRRDEMCIIVAEAEDSWRRRRCARLKTLDGYSFTAQASMAIAKRVVLGEFIPGFQTPGKLYGANFVLGLEGSHREDLFEPFPPMPLDNTRICS
jgi:short subunit dehydrogenase-like uncharacterized protein